jgi:hypothetical protein
LTLAIGEQRLHFDERFLLVEESRAVDIANVALLVDQVYRRRVVDLAFR